MVDLTQVTEWGKFGVLAGGMWWGAGHSFMENEEGGVEDPLQV